MKIEEFTAGDNRDLLSQIKELKEVDGFFVMLKQKNGYNYISNKMDRVEILGLFELYRSSLLKRFCNE